jgi:acyl carrier protein
VIARSARVDPSSFGSDDDLPLLLGLDSLSLLRVVAAVEREFQVTIPDSELHRMRTLRRLLKALGSDGAPRITCEPEQTGREG